MLSAFTDEEFENSPHECIDEDIEFVQRPDGSYTAKTAICGRDVALELFMGEGESSETARDAACVRLTATTAFSFPTDTPKDELGRMADEFNQQSIGARSTTSLAIGDDAITMSVVAASAPNQNRSEEKTVCRLMCDIEETVREADSLMRAIESGKLKPRHVATAIDALAWGDLPCNFESVTMLALFQSLDETYNGSTDPEGGRHKSHEPQWSQPFCTEEPDGGPLF